MGNTPPPPQNLLSSANNLFQNLKNGKFLLLLPNNFIFDSYQGLCHPMHNSTNRVCAGSTGISQHVVHRVGSEKTAEQVDLKKYAIVKVSIFVRV